jgi:hypothetical protein
MQPKILELNQKDEKKKREPKCKTVGRYRQIKINKRTSQMSGCTESLIGNKIPNKIDL